MRHELNKKAVSLKSVGALTPFTQMSKLGYLSFLPIGLELNHRLPLGLELHSMLS